MIDDNYSILFQAALLLFVTGALSPFVFKAGRKVSIASFGQAAIGAVLIVAMSATLVLSGSNLRISSPLATPVSSLSLEFYVDGMSAFFMLIIGLVALAVSIYSIGYSTKYLGKRDIRAFLFLFNMFIMSMVLVAASNSVFSFIIFWEAMSLASFFLVIYDHENEDSIRIGLKYLVMTHLGTAFILGSFLTMYFQTESLSFDSFRSKASLPSQIQDVVFILALIGFGTKAGMIPLHAWLPRTYSSSPSNISALMSAAMMKLAIYGLVRVTLDFAAPNSPDSAWWGMLLVIAGSVSSLIGVLYAIIEKDIKRAIAYSSIENAGIIILGLGLSVIFLSFNLGALAALALLASMYHSLNHAAFKSLLFMGAGSILFSTRTQNMEQMGGLVRKMPWTAFLFLIGAIAISGLPPLNGFVSEWLTMQALFSSYQIPNLELQISVGFAIIAFALTAGIALAAFVKIFAVSFLSRPRSKAAEDAKEVPRTMLAGMGMAAALCVVLGILPFVATGMVASSFGVDSQFPSAASPFDLLAVPYDVDGIKAVSSLSLPGAAILMGSVAAAILGFAAATSRFGRKPTRRVYSTWDGGFGELNERMGYTATSLSQPLRAVFRALYRPHTDVKKDYYSDSNPYIKKSVRVESETADIFENRLYSPVTRSAIAFFDAVRRMQTGKVNAYLLYIMITLILLLLVAGLIS